LTDLYKNHYLTPEDFKIAKKNGISNQRAYERFYYQNWNKERAITTPVRKSRGRSEKEWAGKAKKNGISRNTYYKRREYGWSKEKASSKPIMTTKESTKKARQSKPRKYPDWVYQKIKENGINMSTFKSRINKYYWPLKKACTIPPIKSNEKHPWHKTNKVHFIKD